MANSLAKIIRIMKTFLISILLCTTCVLGKKIAPPPTISDIAGEWIGTRGTETFYLRLKEDKSGKSVYILGNTKDESISLISKWTLNNSQITINCLGMTYPQENYTIVGQASSWEMNVEVRGKNKGGTWKRKLRLRPVKSIEREIALGRQLVGSVNAFDLDVEDGPDLLLEGIKKSASEGNADAQCLLAAIYNKGDGVPKNLAKAAKLYLLAAEQGHDKAQLKLGFIYKDGLGVPQDKAKAYVWFSISANNGGTLNGRGRAGELADEISVLLPNNEIGEAKVEIKRLEKLISAREKENYLQILNQLNKAGWKVEMEKAKDGSHNVRATKHGMTSKSMAPNWRVAFINVLQQCEKWPERGTSID